MPRRKTSQDKTNLQKALHQLFLRQVTAKFEKSHPILTCIKFRGRVFGGFFFYHLPFHYHPEFWANFFLAKKKKGEENLLLAYNFLYFCMWLTTYSQEISEPILQIQEVQINFRFIYLFYVLKCLRFTFHQQNTGPVCACQENRPDWRPEAFLNLKHKNIVLVIKILSPWSSCYTREKLIYVVSLSPWW